MSPRSLPYPVFDIDNHMYETEEALTKYLPKQHRGKVGYVEVKGRPKLVVKDHISHMIPNPTFARVARPGSAEDYFLGKNPDGLNFREFIGEAMDVIPAYQAPAPRLALMDELGIDRCVMYPTLASLIEERTTDDVILTHAIIHALNEWMHEHWTFNYEDRIFATPVVCLPLVDEAIKELHWCLERDIKTFLIRPAPVPSRFGGSRSMGLPEFDPFWQEVVNAGIPVTMHASDSGYQKHLMEWEGGDEYLSFAPSALREVVMGHRAIEDTLAAMICHGALSRFPDLKILCVENGSGWVRNSARATQHRVQDHAEGIRRASGRGVQAQHLHPPVPGGRPQWDCRHHGRGPCHVRLRLPPSRGHRRPFELCGPPRRLLRDCEGEDHGRQCHGTARHQGAA